MNILTKAQAIHNAKQLSLLRRIKKKDEVEGSCYHCRHCMQLQCVYQDEFSAFILFDPAEPELQNVECYVSMVIFFSYFLH